MPHADNGVAYAYAVGSWGNCTDACGTTGVRSRAVFCLRVTVGGTSTAPMGSCAALGEPPTDTHPCNRVPCSDGDGAGAAPALAFSGVLVFDVAMDVATVTASAATQSAVERQIARGVAPTLRWSWVWVPGRCAWLPFTRDVVVCVLCLVFVQRRDSW